jgi:coxsackievirus/adenovirus receptor
LAGFFEFTSSGCRDCGCHEAGSLDNTPWCDAQEGRCRCKQTVEGKQCDRCPPGHFNLDYDNEFGCTKCFCYGHFESCDKADGYFATNITSDFSKGRLGWMGEVGPGMHLVQAQQSERDEAIAVSDAGEGRKTYFVAPAAYTGDRRSSYNQFLVFTLRISTREPRDYTDDVIIEGANGNKMWTQIFAQDNPQPSAQEQVIWDPHGFSQNNFSSADLQIPTARGAALPLESTYDNHGLFEHSGECIID